MSGELESHDESHDVLFQLIHRYLTAGMLERTRRTEAGRKGREEEDASSDFDSTSRLKETYPGVFTEDLVEELEEAIVLQLEMGKMRDEVNALSAGIAQELELPSGEARVFAELGSPSTPVGSTTGPPTSLFDDQLKSLLTAVPRDLLLPDQGPLGSGSPAPIANPLTSARKDLPQDESSSTTASTNTVSTSRAAPAPTTTLYVAPSGVRLVPFLVRVFEFLPIHSVFHSTEMVSRAWRNVTKPYAGPKSREAGISSALWLGMVHRECAEELKELMSEEEGNSEMLLTANWRTIARVVSSD
jgi:hypothetical protein